MDSAVGDVQSVSLDHGFDLECRDAGNVESSQRLEDEDAIDSIQYLRCESGFAQSRHRDSAQLIGLIRISSAEYMQGIGGCIGRENKYRPRSGNLLSVGSLGDEAIVPSGQKILVYVRVRLLEFIQQHDGIGRVTQPRCK